MWGVRKPARHYLEAECRNLVCRLLPALEVDALIIDGLGTTLDQHFKKLGNCEMEELEQVQRPGKPNHRLCVRGRLHLEMEGDDCRPKVIPFLAVMHPSGVFWSEADSKEFAPHLGYFLESTLRRPRRCWAEEQEASDLRC